MPAITRIGDNSTGHDACPPVPAVRGERMFTVSGSPVVRGGDSYAAHGCRSHPSHSGVLAAGAPHMSTGEVPVGRIGDPISCGGSAAQGEQSFTVGDMGGERNNLEAFEYVREALLSRVDEEYEKILLCLPEIAEHVAERQSEEKDRQGWINLRRFMSKWLRSPACDNAESSPEVLWVDMDWILSYKRARDEYYNTFAHRGFLFSPLACQELARMLYRDQFLGEEKIYFDYTTISEKPLPEEKPWRHWKEAYYQNVIVKFYLTVDGLSASMGNFNFRALAAGYTEPLPSGGHLITIERVSAFVWDSFNFEGDDFLIYWSCKDKDYSTFIEFKDYYELSNQRINRFREKYNRGGDFMIFSKPRPIDGLGVFQYETEL